MALNSEIIQNNYYNLSLKQLREKLAILHDLVNRTSNLSRKETNDGKYGEAGVKGRQAVCQTNKYRIPIYCIYNKKE